ncbi:hypothetical protein EB796_010586 [Bugula neritina]|uniref:Uncharacterized protein n=1 Tax=Bugula neritina TaxID=10212 RepID=A0A7J7JXI3_BUGNE|nr:hypothetical protein EB796_010586 [Bugula neritina]
MDRWAFSIASESAGSNSMFCVQMDLKVNSLLESFIFYSDVMTVSELTDIENSNPIPAQQHLYTVIRWKHQYVHKL